MMFNGQHGTVLFLEMHTDQIRERIKHCMGCKGLMPPLYGIQLHYFFPQKLLLTCNLSIVNNGRYCILAMMRCLGKQSSLSSMVVPSPGLVVKL